MLWDGLIAPFIEFGFMRRALVGALALAIGAGPVGVFLMLRRLSLTGDAMAHAILPGAAIGYLVAGLSVGAMTLGGLVAGLIVALLTGVMARTTVLREDAALAVFYLLSLAAGVLIVSLRGSNVDLLHVLFGSVLALDDGALLLLAGVASITVVTLALLLRPLVLECLDPLFLRGVSGAGAVSHFAFLALVVLNLVAGFHALGTLLAVGLMMIPAATARFITADLTVMLGVATLVGALSGAAGILISFHWGVPTGPMIILVAGALCALAVMVGPAGGVLWRFIPARHLEA